MERMILIYIIIYSQINRDEIKIIKLLLSFIVYHYPYLIIHTLIYFLQNKYSVRLFIASFRCIRNSDNELIALRVQKLKYSKILFVTYFISSCI
jgi:hypothetical protein